MSLIDIVAGPYTFKARFEDEGAPKTCAKFRSLLPYRERIIHVRWSGEGCWIPLGDLDLGLPFENHTSYPAPASSCCIQAEFQRRKSCWPMAAFSLPVKWVSSPATIS